MQHTENNAKNSVGSVASKAPSSLLAADILIVDELINIPAKEELEKSSPSLRDRYGRLDGLLENILHKNGSARGGKISIAAEDFKKLSVAVAGLPVKMEAGGSTADILATIKNLHGNNVNIDFLGIAGQDGVGDNLITDDLQRQGIKLSPAATHGAKGAVSFIFTDPDGKRTTITYPGNAAEKLNSEMITYARVAESDSVFIPISLWSKFDSSVPETLLQKSLEQDKEIIVSIPKQARFGYNGAEDVHKKLIPCADVIVADEDELANWYKTDGNSELAIIELQADLAQRDIVRASSGKAPRSKPATAFIKHKDDSATVLVAQSPPNVSPLVPAARYEIAAPKEVFGKKHTLGVDDAMYAGFIAALGNDLPPQNAAEFAMDVAQTKFLYDSVRIPSPIGADKETKERWQDLRHGMSDTMSAIESAIGYAKTGVANAFEQKVPRTAGQKAFDLGLYPLFANIGVILLSSLVTYHSNFNQNTANAFVKRSSWFKEQLSKLPALGKSPEMVKNLNMVIWSFVDGSLMAPLVAAFESKRQNISRWLDDKMGTTPEDKSVYDQEIKRSFLDIAKARAATFAFVIGTYFTLNAKIFPRGAQEGILNEIAANTGQFSRSKAQSINGLAFDVPSKKIGGWLAGIPSIKEWAQKLSGKQLSGLAEKTGTVARKATETDARYQLEGLVNTGIFEMAYTSLCTAGLYILGKKFATNRQDKEDKKEQLEKPVVPINTADNNEFSNSWAEKNPSKTTPKKSENYLEFVNNNKLATAQVGL